MSSSSLNLHPEALDDLRRSGLSDATIAEAGLYTPAPGDLPRLLSASVPFWPTCFCIWRSTTGCARRIQPFRSSGTPTISSRTARRRSRRSGSWRASRAGSSTVDRLEHCRLEVHPEKTRIVYCKDDDRKGRHPQEKFDFLGYTFRPRRSKNRWGKLFVSFTPAVSNDAAKKMRQEMRRWRIPLRSDKAIDDLARMWNAVLRGWIEYSVASTDLPCTQPFATSTSS